MVLGCLEDMLGGALISSKWFGTQKSCWFYNVINKFELAQKEANLASKEGRLQEFEI